MKAKRVLIRTVEWQGTVSRYNYTAVARIQASILSLCRWIHNELTLFLLGLSIPVRSHQPKQYCQVRTCKYTLLWKVYINMNRLFFNIWYGTHLLLPLRHEEGYYVLLLVETCPGSCSAEMENRTRVSREYQVGNRPVFAPFASVSGQSWMA